MSLAPGTIGTKGGDVGLYGGIGSTGTPGGDIVIAAGTGTPLGSIALLGQTLRVAFRGRENQTLLSVGSEIST